MRQTHRFINRQDGQVWVDQWEYFDPCYHVDRVDVRYMLGSHTGVGSRSYGHTGQCRSREQAVRQAESDADAMLARKLST